ncbi:MAG: hypothetical protein ABR584_12700 [Candidatus Baltobacteraceae bacterium]
MQHVLGACNYGNMKLIAALSALGILALGVSAAGAADKLLSLRAVASQSGYSYSWLAAEQAAAIERPGVVIVIRPGNSLYEINDGSEFASSVPQSAGSDILIPQSLARRIRLLAHDEASSAVSRVAPLVVRRYRPGSLSMSAFHIEGTESLAIAGNGPPSVPLTLTVFATLSRDLPEVILSRYDVATDRAGNFSATVSIAPNFMRDSILTVRASSLDSVNPAQAQVLVGPPSPHATVPAEIVPPEL